jgi:hypothetical protein
MTKKQRARGRFSAVRAIKAAKAAGASKVEIDLQSGKIAVYLGQGQDEAKASGSNEWDEAYGADQAKAR